MSARSGIASVLLIFLLSSCTYDYFSQRGQKRFRRLHAEERTQKQLAQLRLLDTVVFRNDGGVYIQEIVSKRNGTGVYGYNRRSSHFGRVHFFLYRNDSVILLSRDNEDTLQKNVTQFLRANDFSTRKVKLASERLKSVYAILSTDSF